MNNRDETEDDENPVDDECGEEEEGGNDFVLYLSPLNKAALFGYLDDIKRLRAEGEDINEPDGLLGLQNLNGGAPLHFAAMNGQLETLEWLAREVDDIDAKTDAGWTALHCAAWYRRLDEMKCLRRHGADIHAKVGNGRRDSSNPQDGQTAMHFAAENGLLEAMEWLRREGAEVDVPDRRSGATPAHCAARGGHLDALKWLKEQGANVGAADKAGVTPMHRATMRGHLEVMVWLKGQGVEIDKYIRLCTSSRRLKKNADLLRAIKWMKTQGVEIAMRDPIYPLPRGHVNADEDTGTWQWSKEEYAEKAEGKNLEEQSADHARSFESSHGRKKAGKENAVAAERLDRLTPEQKQSRKEYALRGEREACRCDPIDEDAARAYAARLMKHLGREHRGTIIVDSPAAALLVCLMLVSGETGMPDLWSRVVRNAEPWAADHLPPGVWEDLANRAQRAALQGGVEKLHDLPDSAEPHAKPNAKTFEKALEKALKIITRLTLEEVKDSFGINFIQTLQQDRFSKDKVFSAIFSAVSDRVWMGVWSTFDHVEEEGLSRLAAAAVYGQAANAIWAKGSTVFSPPIGMTRYCGPCLSGQFLSTYRAWYGFYREQLGLSLPDASLILEQTDFGGVWPMAHHVVVSRRMSAVSMEAGKPDRYHMSRKFGRLYETNIYDGRCHRDGGPVVVYPDGFGVYALRGVVVPAWLALTPAEAIKVDDILRVRDEVARREFIRKAGLERVVEARYLVRLGQQGGYELFFFPVGEPSEHVAYLKTAREGGRWHLNAVAHNIRTVVGALAWWERNFLFPKI